MGKGADRKGVDGVLTLAVPEERIKTLKICIP